MSRLEHIISENRTELDGFEPGNGHFSRFRQKLPSNNYLRIGFGDYLKIAAVVVLASLFSFFLYSQFQHYITSKNTFTLSDVSEEYQEVEEYYTRMISASYSELEQMTTDDPDNKAMLIKELSEMDRLFNSLQQDLTA